MAGSLCFQTGSAENRLIKLTTARNGRRRECWRDVNQFGSEWAAPHRVDSCDQKHRGRGAKNQRELRARNGARQSDRARLDEFELGRPRIAIGEKRLPHKWFKLMK